MMAFVLNKIENTERKRKNTGAGIFFSHKVCKRGSLSWVVKSKDCALFADTKIEKFVLFNHTDIDLSFQLCFL